ncbi:MAG: YetF domain-containing protein [Bacillota bacterium]
MSAVAATAIRAVVFFVWLVILVRFMGKRQVGELTSELASLLRQAEAFSLSDVEFAILEPTGKLSVKKKKAGGSGESGQTKTPGDGAGSSPPH